MKTDTQALRDQILYQFLQAGGEPISGTKLSEQTGVTRTAIWKHIHQLEELGFTFDSAPKVGHRLTYAPDVLMEPLLPDVFQHTGLGHPVVFSPEVDSTNRLASELASQGAPHGTLVTAQEQTSGRGRRGRVWFSHPGGAWFSLILRRPFALSRAFELTLLASVALQRVISQLTKLDVQIKWPNDLFVNDRKVGGILAEIRSDGEQVHQAVVGIGINCNIPIEAFPEEVSQVATSLSAESGQMTDRTQLVGRFLALYGEMLEFLFRGEPAFERVHEEWCAHSHTLGRQVRVQTNRDIIEGRAVQLDKDGTLMIRNQNGEDMAVHSGEVLF